MAESSPSPSPGHFFLDRVSPAVREALVKERVRAMEGRIEETLQSLDDALRLLSKDRSHDVVALGSLQAELLYLDFRYEDALSVMEKVVVPHLTFLTAEERLGIERNRSGLQFYVRGSDIGLFYNIVDQGRLLDFTWLNYRDLFVAKQNSDSGKHFETLPILWQQHRRAYLHSCWVAQQWTSQLLAKECIHLKHWQDAVHYFLFARDDSLLKDLAGGILFTRDSDAIDRVVNRLFTTANLRAHFGAASKLLSALEDAIPDAWIPRIGEWLLKRAREPYQVLIGANHVSAAWEAIAAIAVRFPADLAQKVVAVAISKLSEPHLDIFERKEIVRSLVPMAQVIPSAEIASVANAALPLITDRSHSIDYNEVVNLLCHLAERGGTIVKDLVGASLYSPEKPISRVLAQVADIFGRAELFEPIRIQRLAEQVELEIRRQTQWLEPNQAAEPVAEQILEFSSSKSGRTLKVYVVGLQGLHVLAQHRKKLDEQKIGKLLKAILDSARNRDNFCSNREALLHALIKFADVSPPAERLRVQAALEPLARGHVEESSEYPTAAETENPMNPFKYRSGRPEDVQGMALIALAAFSASDPGATKRLGELLEDSVCDHRPKIRRAGYAAARWLSDVSEGVILGILAGLRDPDPNAALAAFASLADRTTWKLNRNHWRVFLMATRLTQRMGDSSLRRNAASALVAWSSKCPPQFEKQCAELVAESGHDICWSVRNIVNRCNDGSN